MSSRYKNIIISYRAMPFARKLKRRTIGSNKRSVFIKFSIIILPQIDWTAPNVVGHHECNVNIQSAFESALCTDINNVGPSFERQKSRIYGHYKKSLISICGWICPTVRRSLGNETPFFQFSVYNILAADK